MIQDGMQTTLAIARVAVSWAYLAVKNNDDSFSYVCIYQTMTHKLPGNAVRRYLTMHNIIS